MTIRFFHTADLHLESPFKGSFHLPSQIAEELRGSTFKAFSKLVDRAIEERPDFILIVGDIYDGENRSLSAQYNFQQQLERLNKEGVPVVISYGNHDHLSGSWTRLSLPENVYEFTEDVSVHTLTIRGQKIRIHGFSYKKRHIEQPMIELYPKKMDDELHIGMLHGSVDTDSEHAVYAPFTINQLVEKQYDYWALGHIHKRQVLSEEPPIVYSGNIQGRHRKEVGEKGYYDVELSSEECRFTFQETTVIRYMEQVIDCSTVNHATELLELIESELDLLRQQYGAVMLELSLTNFTEAFGAIYLQAGDEEWLQTIREQQVDSAPFVWIQSLQAQLATDSFQETALTTELFQTIDELSQEQLFDMTADLFNQPKYAKYMDRLSEGDWQQLQQQAIEKLQRHLSMGGK